MARYRRRENQTRCLEGGRENEHCNSKNVGYWEAEDGGMAMLPNEGQDGYTNKTSSCQTLVWPSIEFIQQAET